MQNYIELLNGSIFHQGQVHGNTYKHEVEEMLNGWAGIYAEIGKTTIEEVFQLARNMTAESRLLENARKGTPLYVEELEGIADGSEKDFKLIYAMVENDSFLYYIMCHNDTIKNFIDALATGCTTGVQIDGQGNGALFQNQDYFSPFTPYTLATKQRIKDTTMITFGYSGVPTVMGCNNHDIAMSVNTISEVIPDGERGYPQLGVMKECLMLESIDKIIDFIRTHRPAAGTTYGITDARRAVFIEAGVEFFAFKEGNAMGHANTCLYGKPDPVNPMEPLAMSDVRGRKAQALVDGAPVRDADIFNLLRGPVVYLTPESTHGTGQTHHSVIYRFEGGKIQYVRYQLSNDTKQATITL
ncbi:MAG: hypothetical protein JRH15_07320 [Deltaproteobacteria bacterium]|nr:hypothetical protein [Deltaproteobacteria bacterium]